MSFCDEHGTADYCGECVYGPEIERLTAERDAAQAEAASWRRVAERLETEKQDSQAEARELKQRIDIMLCQACHDRCNTPPTGLFHSPDPEEEPCIICWLEQQSDETVKHAERADKAEAEARELRAEIESEEKRFNAQQDLLYRVINERDVLRFELARVREIVSALSQAAEQHDPLAVSDHCGECGEPEPECACDERIEDYRESGQEGKE